MRLFNKKNDGAELAAAEAFHITRADWSYIKDPAYIERIHRRGWTFQGSMNAVTRNTDFAKRDADGQPMLDHFGKPGRYWSDNDNESYRQWYLAQLAEWIEAGVDSIQRDEPTTCNRTPVPDAARFLKEIHARFEEKLGRHVPMSCNLAWNSSVFGGVGESVAMLFDFGMAEMGQDKVRPEFLWHAARDARDRGKAMVYTSHQEFDVPTYRRAIAGCYATGMHFMVPWDQFGGLHKPRVFSKPEDLADLYGFIRANARYLDDYEDAAATGCELTDTRWNEAPILHIEGTEQVSAFVRAKPGDASAPVVVHLIDLSEPTPFVIRLRRRAFFDSAPVAVALRTPVPYDAGLHEEAETSKAYESLSCPTPLPTTSEDDWTVVEIPALRPWGLLIVSRATSPNGDDNP